MIKLARFLRFADQDRDEAWRGALEVRGRLAAAVSGVCGYAQNRVVDLGDAELGAGRADVPVDAYEFVCWPDHAAFDVAVESSQFRRWADDTVGLAASDSTTALLDEHIVKDGERGPFKLASFTPFRRDLSAEVVRDPWTRQHGPLTLRAGGFTRYVQNHVLTPAGDDGGQRPAFDGVAEHWFRSADDFHRVRTTAEWRALVEDGHQLFEMDKVSFAVVEEVVYTS